MLDDSVCLNAVLAYSDSESWAALEAVAADVKRDHVWVCTVCSSSIGEEERCVACESCLQWIHFGLFSTECQLLVLSLL